MVLKRINVMIVDDHEVVREGIKAVLKDPYRVVASVGCGSAALKAAPALRPEVAIIDMRLPDISGPELCTLLRICVPGIHVVVLSGISQDDAIEMAHRAGACHYITKHQGISALRNCLDELTRQDSASSTAHGRGHAAPHAEVVELAPELVRELTETEEQVLELAAQGLTDREIGHRLFLAESTVRFHLQRLKVVLTARSKTEAVAKAIRLGLLSQTLEGTARAIGRPVSLIDQL